MSRPVRMSIPLILVLFLILAPVQASAICTQEARAPAIQALPDKEGPAEVHAGPKNIKEKTAVLVFLAWTWLLVGVLVYFIRMKIKEVDRVYEIRFYTAAETDPRMEQNAWKPKEKA